MHLSEDYLRPSSDTRRTSRWRTRIIRPAPMSTIRYQSMSMPTPMPENAQRDQDRDIEMAPACESG